MPRSTFLVISLLLAANSARAQHPQSASHDSAFRATQERGRQAMGVDQYTSTHHFDALPDGGRIELQRDVDDSTGIARIRSHIREIAQAFKAGDFSTPAIVHMKDVPGAKTMSVLHSAITYEAHDLPRGAELRIRTHDPEALRAIHQFMAFQRGEHHATGMK
ncbi:MAG: hypothetical protein ACJ796_15530 [Gemmatimonadaceae bacterium]